MMIADKTHVVYSNSRDTKKGGAYETGMVVVKYEGNYYFMWDGSIENDNEKDRFSINLFMDKAGVFYHAEIVQRTLVVRNFRPAMKGPFTTISTCDNDLGRVQLGLMMKAIEFHKWDLPTLFEKVQHSAAQFLEGIETIDNLKKRLEKMTDAEVNYDLK